MITITLLAAPLALTLVEFCSAAPEPPATKPPEWHWRMVDGKKCYFRADKLLPRENLVWSYDAKQLDLEEGATIRGQRHYTPQELKATSGVSAKWAKTTNSRLGARNFAKAAGAIMMTKISTPDFPPE